MGTPIGVIRDQGSGTVGSFGGRNVVVDPNHFMVQRSDVAAPKRGDTLTIGADVFKINGAPTLDDEGLAWRCPAEPA